MLGFSPNALYSLSEEYFYAIVNVTGVVGTTALGSPSLMLNNNVPLSSTALVASVGTPTIKVDSALTLAGVGVVGTASTGTVKSNVSAIITGVATTGTIGGVIPRPGLGIFGFDAFSAAGFSSVPISQGSNLIEVKPNTTGVVGTSAVGTLTAPDRSPILVGVVGTSPAGLLNPTILVTISSAPSATASVSAPTGNPRGSITGLTATGVVGVAGLIESSSPTLVGQRGLSVVGNITPLNLGIVSGVSATASAGSLAKLLTGIITSPALSGVSGTLQGIPNYYGFPTGSTASGQIGNTSVQISGTPVSAVGTGAIGTFNKAIGYSLISTPSTGVVGSAVGQITIGITGTAGTGQIGATIGNPVGIVAGVVATGTLGTTNEEVDCFITGVSSSAQSGSVKLSLVGFISGNAGTGQLGGPIQVNTTAISGVNASGFVGSLGLDVDDSVTLVSPTMTGIVNIVTTSGDANPVPAGVVGTLGSSSVTPEVKVISDTTVIETQGLPGNPNTTSSASPISSGVLATAGVGFFNVSIPKTSVLTGISATGLTGVQTPLVKGFISGLGVFAQPGYVYQPGSIATFITGLAGVCGQGQITGISSPGLLGVFGSGNVGTLTTTEGLYEVNEVTTVLTLPPDTPPPPSSDSKIFTSPRKTLVYSER